jgi:hypothetical protein
MAVGFLEGVTGVIAEEDNEIGGLRITRLTSPAPPGATTITVETTVDWEDSGTLGIEGQKYSYTGKTLTTFTGITHEKNQATVSGTIQQHREEIEVIDLSRTFSAIDLLRRALLVEYAESDDLNALGRNLGVLRLPSIGDDDLFREIIKALAYNPRGTMFGIELALTAMVGEGNFEISEDLINFPNTVFITLSGDAALSDSSEGKYYPSGDAASPATSDTTLTVLTSDPIITIGGIRWKDENHVTDTTTQKPSADSIEEYDGDPGTTVWAYTGPSEAADVILTAGEYIEITDSSGADVAKYTHQMRIQPESDALLEVVFEIPAAATIDAGGHLQWCAHIADTSKRLAWGIVANGPDYDIGLIGGAGFISGAAATLNKDEWHSVVLEKNGQDTVNLKIDGSIVQTISYDDPAWLASGAHNVEFGSASATLSGIVGRVKSVGYFATTSTDYWNSRGTGGDVSSGAPSNLDVNIVSHFVSPDDEGKTVEIKNATTVQNNGRWIISSVATDEIVVLVGPDKSNGTVLSNGANFKAFGEPKAFKYPDDIGKKVVISGTTSNDGTYYISSLYREGSNFTTDLSTFLTVLPEQTSEATLSTTYPGFTAATLLVDTGMTWRLDPNFDTEGSIEWEMSDAGSLSGVVATLRQALPITTGGYTRVLDVFFTEVLSGQTLEDADVENLIVSTSPLVYTYYPIYVGDPLGFIQTYLDDITVAGVIPEYTSE